MQNPHLPKQLPMCLTGRDMNILGHIFPFLALYLDMSLQMQHGRPVRVRKPPVAFWAGERAVVDNKTGVAQVEKPFKDWLAFGKPDASE